LFTFILIPILIIAPVAILLYYFWVRDKWQREPWSLIFKLFGLGCVAVIPAAIIELIIPGNRLVLDGIPEAMFSAFIGVSLVEESVKYIFTYFFTFRSRHFNEEYDGIVYGVSVGLGFAFLENILYVASAVFFDQAPIAIAIQRALTAVPVHALNGVIMGFFIGRAHFERNPSRRLFINFQGLLYAVLIHGLYDFFIFTVPSLPSNIVTWAIIGIFSIMAIQWAIALALTKTASDRSESQTINRLDIRFGHHPTRHRPRFCRTCGHPLTGSGRFCKHCGNPIE